MAHEEALNRSGVRVLDLTGRPVRGRVVVDADGVPEDDQLRAWVARCVDVARVLPSKEPTPVNRRPVTGRRTTRR